MTAEQWEQVKTVFEAAAAMPEPQRQQYVSDACKDQNGIRETILELLEHHTETTVAVRERPGNRAPALAVDDLIAGRFRITRLIASGGMGEVYEAYDEWLRLRLALKTVRPELLAEPEALDRFKRELLVTRRVSHENVCRVFDFAEHRTSSGSVVPCYTMELLEGESLAEWLAHARPLSTGQAAPLIRQIAAGLQVLHEQEIIHRDLKPSNIMIVPRAGRDPRAVVMDFGLAKLAAGDAGLFESVPEVNGGAPYFMAPELLKRGRPTVASDIYSFGLVIDEMVTHSRAFPGGSLQALYYDKLWEKPLPPSARSRDLPPAWEHAILRCLEAEPSSRFTAVADVVRTLEAPPEPAPTAAPPPSEPQPVPRRRLSRRAAIGALIATPTVGATAAVAALAFQQVNASIDVQDIDNQTNQPEYDYLCKGTTAELMRQLLQLHGVRVFHVRQARADAPVQKAGRFSLEGMLQLYSGQIRLSMQLYDRNQQNALLWSDNFDRRSVGDPLALQTDIARNAVAAVERRVLLGAEGDGRASGTLASAAYRVRHLFSMQAADALPGPPTSSATAFDLYMRGHHVLEELSPDTASASIGYFKRAIDEDPNFALAYASTADAYMALMNYNYVPHPELAKFARYYAVRAVELGPNLAEAHSVQAAVQQMDWDWNGAEASYRRALSLKPNLGRAHRWFGGFILQFGRFDEALREARYSMELDPYDRSGPPIMGLYLYFAGRYQEAVDLLESRAGKDVAATHHHLAQIYAWLGYTTGGSHHYFQLALDSARRCESIERLAAERSGSQDKSTSYTDQLFGLVYALQGDHTNAAAYLARLQEEMQAGKESPATLAWVQAILGRRDQACELLEQAASWRDRRLLYTKVIPYLTSLHGYPRFEALLRQMNLAS
jgi:serine/threonine-protein kinase